MKENNNLTYRSYLEIDTSIIKENVKNIQEFIGDTTKMMSILKADAYGMGIERIAKEVEPLTDWYGVATAEEAFQIRQQYITKPILVMGYVRDEYIQKLIDLNITICTISVEYIKHINDLIPKGQKLDVHIKIDTGMNRIGLYSSNHNIDDFIRQIDEIHTLEKINITGIYSHLVSAGSTNPAEVEFTQHQYDIFVSVCNAAVDKGYDIGLRHFCNSYGTIYNRDMHLDMVRVGIFIAFGHYLEIDDLNINLSFKLKARIVNLKRIDIGEAVGYDRTFKAEKSTVIASVGFGYVDGYRSNQSNITEVIINGKRARMVGRIAMDYLMVDVTGHSGVKVGDYVTLIGIDGEEKITPYENAMIVKSTIPEINTQIGQRVNKVYS